MGLALNNLKRVDMPLKQRNQTNLQWLICHKNPTKPTLIYSINLYKEDLALNKLQWFICHKT